ncbi:hypothetical protein M3Y99_00348500 [Aphelenchoides fujianensis]|nr:hypothetical protein M3Y99_00348500 [Aphelenchoides fujianensis]
MLAQAPLLLHLTSSFLISTLRLHIEPENADLRNHEDVIQTPFILISPNRNISLSFRGSTVLADGVPLMTTNRATQPPARSPPDGLFTVTARCQHGFAIRLIVNDFESLIPSPSFCANHLMNEILIGPDDREHESFYGCIRNVTLGPNQILSSWCRLKSTPSRLAEESRASTSTESLPPVVSDLQLVYVGERLRCAEGGSVRLQWKNLYLFPEHRRYRIQYEDVRFHVLDGPAHGHLAANGTPVADFSYDDLVNQRLSYEHDGSETTEDSVDFKVWMEGPAARFTTDQPPQVLTLPLQIDPVDDPPQLIVGPEGGRMNPSTWTHPTQDVWIEVRKQQGAHLSTKEGVKTTRFSLAQYLNGKVVRTTSLARGILFVQVYVESEGGMGEIQLSPQGNPHALVTLRILSAPINLRLITAANLSVTTNFPDLSVQFAVVDQAEFGLVECLRPLPTGQSEEFQLCSEFTQQDLQQFRVRYRHTSESRPSSDSFSFYVRSRTSERGIDRKLQAQSGEERTAVHQFAVDFVPISIRVFVEESLFLNNTQQALLVRSLHLIFHIVEPPKFGMLQREVENGRMRRIGLSSNFTQQHVDDGTVVYKLHYPHFAVLNDFFTFRVVTPAVASELLRFDITFIPGGNALQLINRTLVVDEGRARRSRTARCGWRRQDESNFVFTVAMEPLYGNLSVSNERGQRVELRTGDSFTSLDLLNERLEYKHAGKESKDDRRSNTKIPLWLQIRVIPDNDQPPHLAAPFRSLQSLTIHVRENGERVLYSSLLPWRDPDSAESRLDFFFPELFREFTISRRNSPEIPVRNFTNFDLRDRVLLLRHVSRKPEAVQRYVVSDGRHAVQSEVRFVATADLFVRLSRSRSLRNGSSFTPFVEPQVIKLVISALHVNAEVVFRVEPTDEVEPLQLRLVDRLNLPPTATVPLDEAVWSVRGGNSRSVLFLLERAPSFGSVVLVREAVGVSVVHPLAWRLEEWRSGELRYVHHGGAEAPDHDFLLFNISTAEDEEKGLLGPFRLDVQLARTARPVLLVVRNLTLPWGSSAVVNTSNLRLLLSSAESGAAEADVRFVVTRLPDAGRLLVNGGQLQAGTDAHFTYAELQNAHVVFTASGGKRNGGPSPPLRPTSTAIGLQACERYGCSEEVTLHVRIEADNLQGTADRLLHPRTFRLAPELLRNEPLFTIAQRAVVITSRHLHAADSDTAADELRFLIWQPTGGHVAFVNNQSAALLSFTQADVNEGRVMFVSTGEKNASEHVGFSFLVTDGVHQTRAEWFAVEKGRNPLVELDANVRLNAAPAVLTLIGADVLRARLVDVPAHDVLFRITRPPTHGKIVHETSGGRAVENFTQADIDALRISYSASSVELGAWSVRDHFNFVISNAKEDANSITSRVDAAGALDHENDFRFRVLVSYAFVEVGHLAQFVALRPLNATRGGSPDAELDEVEKPPMHGFLEFISATSTPDVDGESGEEEGEAEERVAVSTASVTGISPPSRVITADELHTGRYLAYRHDGGTAVEDEFTLAVFSFRERHRRNTRLRIPMAVRIDRPPSNVQVERFRSTIHLVSGGSTTLLPSDFMAVDLNDKQSDVVYRVVQAGSNGVRLATNGTVGEVASFGQRQVDGGQIRLEHTPLSGGHDVLVLQVGGHLRVLHVRVEPLALQLFNFTPISFVQGRTFVVLDRKHLGADSNGERDKIVYNVTRKPENGSLYWVNGEQEVRVFTQKNIDDGDVLYAQLNLEAFQDDFDFILYNEELELLQKTAKIVVLPPFDVQPLIASARSVAQVSISHLNASSFEGAAPRFLIVDPPRYGRFFLYPDVNTTVNFFSLAHIVDGRLFLQTAELHEPFDDKAVLELRADDVQPSRFKWPIQIAALTEEERAKGGQTGGFPPNTKLPTLPQAPELNFRFPIIILAGMVVIVILFSLCRKNKNDKKKQLAEDAIPNIGTRELPELDDEPRPTRKSVSALQPGPLRRGNDLLESTVYASESIKRRPPPILQAHDFPAPSASTAASRPKATTFEVAETPKPLTINRPPFGPAYRSTALAAVNAAAARPPTGRSNTRLNDNQYWV